MTTKLACEEFPALLAGVERVIRLDDERVHRVAGPAGGREEWNAEIAGQELGRRIPSRWSGTESGARRRPV